jgi:hypothetical protein
MGTRHIFRSFGAGAGMSYRERVARRRLQRIRFRNNWPIEMWILVILMIAVIFMAPRLAELHNQLHHPKAHQH